MTYYTPIIATALALHCAWAAAPKFDRVYGSHMVLPHSVKVPITGTADPGESITIKFGSTSITTKSNADGKWKVVLPPMKPSATGRNLSASQNGETTRLEDILVGELWVASGQSNMLFRMNETNTQKEDIPKATNSKIRFLNNRPQSHTNNAHYSDKDFANVTTSNFYKGEWQVCSPSTVPTMSAVGYYFGEELCKNLNIPVGIIHSSLGGSEIVAWFPKEVVDNDEKFSSLRGNHWLQSHLISDWVKGRAKKNITPRLNSGTPDHPYKPTFLYEAGISWTTQLPISGVLWYQGESDAEIIDNKQNSMLLETMINSWKKAYNNPKLPFVMIQLPRINDGSKLRAGWPEFREMQDDVAKYLTNVYCVNTIDLGSTNSNVHPPFKRPVGERAAATALNKIYKKKIACDGPALKDCKPKGNKLLIQLTNAKGLTTTDKKAPTEFEIAGADGKFYPATAKIEKVNGQTAIISLTSEQVKAPTQGRYCWKYFVTPNLINSDKLPARPFRTHLSR